MQSFPSDVRFRSEWRDYQARVLDQLKNHIKDGRLHVVAAPGSGKTVLGLEVVRRLNRPALILAPTRTIREQWVERLSQSFLAEPHVPAWVSSDLWEPRLLTVATYQALHTAFAGDESTEEFEEESDENSDIASEPQATDSVERGAALVALLREAGIRVLVVDEAHHLRTEWWKSLMAVFQGLNSPSVVALTATPPYDVSPAEWDRYEELCGPVDTEIPVPDLVYRGDLCPHQDCVYFSAPTVEESWRLAEFRNNVEQFRHDLLGNAEFAAMIAQHPWLISPNTHLEEILEDPAYASSLIIYLNGAGQHVPAQLPRLLGVSRKRLPIPDLEWIETLLTGCLYSDSERFESSQHLLHELGRRLRDIGGLERRRVVLRKSTASARLLTGSLNKLQSIADIVRLESENLAAGLRAVVLADFIRKNEMPQTQSDRHEFQQLGVVPIFETLRRAEIPGTRLGVLSGSLVVVPRSAFNALQVAAEASGLDKRTLVVEPLQHCNEFLRVSFQATANSHVVRVVTRLFRDGEITVLVGTTSLLGEGWDAPSINCLILASGVGSYMLSNQMRGRAIRIDPRSPHKTANIWHLVTVEPDWQAGEDFETLVRRFRSFVGVARDRKRIENGIGRLSLGDPPFSRERIDEINETMKQAARARGTLRTEWNESLASGKTLVEAVEAPARSLPRSMVFANTLAALCWQGLMLGVYVSAEILKRTGRIEDATNLWLALKVAAVAGAVVAIPFLLKAAWWFLRHGTIERSLREVGRALLEALVRSGIVQRSSNLRVYVDTAGGGKVQCWLSGGSPYERSVFLTALREVLDPIQNPRYLLVRRSRWLSLGRRDFHSVPEVLGRKKDQAAWFHRRWLKHVGLADLVYTRTLEGRQLVLRARARALSAHFQSRSDRRSCWK